MEQRWNTTSRVEAQRLREEAEDKAANDAGAKLIGVTLELDRLLDVVAGIAGEVKKDADARLKVETVVIVAVSLGLAVLALIPPTGKLPVNRPALPLRSRDRLRLTCGYPAPWRAPALNKLSRASDGNCHNDR